MGLRFKLDSDVLPLQAVAVFLMPMIDSHAHLDSADFDGELEGIIERARVSGISRIITIGTDLESSRRSVAIAERHDAVYAVVGWHPCTARSAPADLVTPLLEMARHPKVVAIGETGLDFHHRPSQPLDGSEGEDEIDRLAQERVFLQQLEVAAETQLNVVVHQRDAFSETIERWRPYAKKGVRAVCHCFVGTPEQAREIIELGGLVSFTGIVTFKSADRLRETVAGMPLDRLMVETDCPYLAPVPHRGKRCEPAFAREIGQTIAELKSIDWKVIEEQTNQTAMEFFRGLRV